MKDYRDKLTLAEHTIGEFINGKITVQKVESVLSSIFSSCDFYDRKNTFDINVVKTDRGKETFFGARVYPAIDLLDNVVNETVVELHPFKDIHAAWKKIDHWIIELDSNMFNRQVISLVPGEIVAAILHEIGHTIYSDRALERFYRAYRSMYVHMKSAEKDTVKLGYAVFTIPLAMSCGIRSWMRGNHAIREEFFADTIVNECGYGDFYISLLSKIIEAYGNSMVDTTDVAADNRISERVRWASLNITDTVRRKNRLKDDMYLQAANTPSKYMKALCAKVLNDMGVNLRERYTGDAVECTVENLSDPNFEAVYEIITDTERFHTLNSIIESTMNRDKYRPGTPAFESILRSKVKKGLPSWAEIDRIQIEIDRMTNHHDRMFVLDMIYQKIDDINDFMNYVDQADPNLYRKYKVEAERMLEDLDAKREAVLRRRNFATRYSVFAKYPDGYEG